MTSQVRRKRRVGARRRRRNKIIALIFVLLFILCIFIVMRASVSLPYETVELTDLAKVEFDGFNNDGVATVSVNDAAVDELLAKVKQQYEDAWFHTSEVEDGDYVKFRQSLSFSIPNSTALSNGSDVNVLANCDETLAKKLKIKIGSKSGKVTVEGLQNVMKLPVDTVFSDLKVSFSGISPSLEISIQNESEQPLVQKMIFEIEDPKEYYSDGDVVRIRARYTEDMCRETGYIIDAPEDGCVREYVAESDSSYIRNAADLPGSIIQEAIDAGKRAFTDANEHGVRVFCEANLVPVYINKKATFTYGTPKYVSAYFKTVFPEKAGELGLSYNDLDIIYEVTISQADGKACNAYGAVRFSNFIANSDGTYSYDLSNPQLLSVSYLSSRVKSNVVDSYKKTHDIERVSP